MTRHAAFLRLYEKNISCNINNSSALSHERIHIAG